VEATGGHRPGAYVTVAVTDTGEGIDQESQKHLFEPFFSTRAHREGTGLGLSVVYGMIEQHGGFIRVKSEPGQGARFELYLPTVAAAACAPGGEAADGRGSETILVVEEEAGALRLIGETLRDFGYTTLETADSADALEMAGREGLHVDLLLTDIVTPNVNGQDLADAWRALHPDVKVLFMSEYRATSADWREQLLQKPFSGARLTQKVREVLDGR
jgi:two-component system cell cycle sensor histidine kinase/response regulator CckA